MNDEKKQSATLWSGSARTRHFIIPDDTDLVEGHYEIRTVLGKQEFVDESRIATFEVDREKAKEWIKGELNGVIAEAATSFAKGMGSAASMGRSNHEAADSSTSSRHSTPGPDSSRSASGTSRPADEPGLQAITDFVSTLGNLSEVIKKSRTGNDEDLASAKEHLKQVREVLDRRGIRVSDAVDTLPEKIQNVSQRAAGNDPEPDEQK